MKKFLLFAMMASVMLAGNAALPERTIIGQSHQMKSIGSAADRQQARKAVRRAAAKDADAATAIAVPFTHSLGKNESITSEYIVIDANGDEKTWKPGGFTSYSTCMISTSKTATSADDWMISPAIHLEAGQYYTVSFEYDMTLNKLEDKLGLYAGTERTVEGMTIAVVPEFSYPYSNKVFQTKEAQLSVKETGNYYFGFHCTSEIAKTGNPKLCNFSIKECENPIVVPEKFAEVPCSYTMSKNSDDAANYIVIDADNDTKTWKPCGMTTGSVCAKTTYENQDDWLITLPVHLLPGVNYTLTYKEGFSQTTGKEDRLGVYAGTSPTVEAMNLTILAAHTYTNRDAKEVKTDFNVTKEGYYYFGFHCTSAQASTGWARISDFSIKESTEEIVPPAAGTLEVIPAPMGELKATVKYTAPSVNTNGEPLTQLTKVIVTTNWAFKTELTDVEPGGEYTFETTDVYNNGYNRFEAVAYIGDVAGEQTLLTDLYFGMDNPQPVTNVKAVLSEDFKTVTLTWDPISEVGEKGGYVDVSKAVYYVFDAFGSYYDPALTYTTETSVTFDYSDVKEQDFVAYQVTAGIDETYYSLDTSSNIVVIGQPEALPFYESFADGNYSHMWVVDPESQGQVMNGTLYDNELQTNTDADEGVEPEYLNSQDADNGFFLFMPIDINSSYGFYSAKISLAGADNPVFEFWYQGKGSVLDAKLGANGGDLETIKSIDLKENPTDDWTLARIDLSPYKSANYIQVGVMLRAIHNTDENIWSVPFDNLRVIDLKDEALRVSVVSIPDEVNAGQEIPVSMTVENIGLNELTQANIAVVADGVDFDPIAIADFTPGKVATVKAAIPTSLLSDDAINVVASAKTNASTVGASVEKTVSITFPAYPMPTDFTAAAAKDKIDLSWTAPEYDQLTKPTSVFEDFESPEYEPFTYSDFAGFRFVDLDGQKNYTFLSDYGNPYRTVPMAYQLFSPELAGVPEDYLIDCPTHSGKSMLVAWSCGGQNANLLISPELTGDAQTISFWARSFTIAYGETISVWVSYTDTDVKSFTQIKEIENYAEGDIVPEDWTEFKINIPEGAKYFGILHDSYDTYALFLDDFKFETAGVLPADTELTGYNLYCNGEKVGESTETSTVHTPDADGAYSYRLSAVYNHGESRPTAPVEVMFNGHINGESSAEIGDGVTIECHDRVMTVTAAEGTPISVIDLSGRVLATGDTSLTTAVPANGVVFVAAGKHTAKVIVK